MQLHHGSPDFGDWRSIPFHPLCICLSLVKTQWPYACQNVIWETWEETLSAASGEPLERILFPGFLYVISWAQEFPDGTVGAECSRAVTGLLFSIYTHSLGDLIQFYSFVYLCQPLPHSSPVQHSLPSSRCCLLNITKCILSKLNCQSNSKSVLYLHHSPFQAGGHSIFQMLRSNTSALCWFLSYTQFLIHQKITIAVLQNMSSI